ncbi:MAG: GGDEF domain-containing protein [Gammaproteobacteria bacterium]|nr:GGDEF domain-containing protein [Gammaproteobacteria bacterium]
MPQSKLLSNTVKQKAPVIALNSRVLDPPVDTGKQLRNFQLSDLLSRDLEINLIIQAFSDYIQTEFPHGGYQYENIEMGLSLDSGVTRGHLASYGLKMQSRSMGEITFYRETRFNADELSNLEDLLCTLIYPVKNALMYQVALESAHTDPLTGLSNRTAMEKLLPREIELSNRHSQTMAIMVMDLDGFKAINDRYGHDVGDQVLRDVGGVLQSAVRNTDLLYRFGGDEFVGGLPQTDINGAFEVSERIRQGVEKLKISSPEISSHIEISIGITMLRSGDKFNNAFKRADKALYQAKKGGKNRIVII